MLTLHSVVNETANRNQILEICKLRFRLVHWIDPRSIEHNYACWKSKIVFTRHSFAMQTLTDWAIYDCLAVGSGITEVYLDNNDDESYNDNTNMHISIVLAIGIPFVCPSVCLSVSLSHAGIVSKRRHVARCSLHCRI